jgi:alkyl hydroperoxide reductase subunit AhpC
VTAARVVTDAHMGRQRTEGPRVTGGRHYLIVPRSIRMIPSRTALDDAPAGNFTAPETLCQPSFPDQITRVFDRGGGNLRRSVGDVDVEPRRNEMLAIGDTAPDFEAQTTQGPIKFHDWIGDSWAVLFSHPKDFTPICTTELGYMAKIKPEFDRRGVKIIGLSVDSTDDHERWAKDIAETQGTAPNYPIIGDVDFNVAKLYGMLPADTAGDVKSRTPAQNATVRNVFVIGPDKKVKLIFVYPMSTGRNFDEVLRVIDSLQLTAKHPVSTPVNWQRGEDVIIGGAVSDDDAKKHFPDGWEAPKPYIRIVKQPT